MIKNDQKMIKNDQNVIKNDQNISFLKINHFFRKY